MASGFQHDNTYRLILHKQLALSQYLAARGAIKFANKTVSATKLAVNSVSVTERATGLSPHFIIPQAATF